jgi:hypothetical protein
METKYRVDERTIEECVKGKDGSYEFFRTEGVFGALKKRDLGREVNRVLFETSSVSTDSAFISEQIVNLAGFYDAIQRTNSTIEDVVALGSTAAGKAESEYFNSLYSFKAAVECCLHEFRTYIDARRKKIKQEKHTQSSSFTVQICSRHTSLSWLCLQTQKTFLARPIASLNTSILPCRGSLNQQPPASQKNSSGSII